MKRCLLLMFALWVSAARAESVYLRVEETGEGDTELQVAVKRFRLKGPKPVTLWLAGVAHVGTAEYFGNMQRLLDESDVVLYEGVDGDREAFRNRDADDPAARSALQAQLSRALGLVFQLDAIRYDREHFVNSDLSGVELLALFGGDEPDTLTESGRKRLEELLATMEQESPGGQIMGAMLAQLEGHPQWRRGMRWALARVMGNVRGDPSEYPGLPADMRELMRVLIHKRNDAVMEDVRTHLPELEAEDVITVFYGAAHMPDFEKRLKEEFQAEPAGEEWLTAFGANLDRSGLNSVQKGMLRWFVNRQVAAMRMLTGQTGAATTEPDEATPESEGVR